MGGRAAAAPELKRSNATIQSLEAQAYDSQQEPADTDDGGVLKRLPHTLPQEEMDRRHPTARPEHDEWGEPDATPFDELKDPTPLWKDARRKIKEDEDCMTLQSVDGHSVVEAEASVRSDVFDNGGAWMPKAQGIGAVGECQDIAPCAHTDGGRKRGRLVRTPLGEAGQSGPGRGEPIHQHRDHQRRDDGALHEEPHASKEVRQGQGEADEVDEERCGAVQDPSRRGLRSPVQRKPMRRRTTKGGLGDEFPPPLAEGRRPDRIETRLGGAHAVGLMNDKDMA